MNFISATHTVSVFPRSTFVNRRSFVACQERMASNDPHIEAQMQWLKTYKGDLGAMEVIGAVTARDIDVEIGPRWLGDSRCWSFSSFSRGSHHSFLFILMVLMDVS